MQVSLYHSSSLTKLLTLNFNFLFADEDIRMFMKINSNRLKEKKNGLSKIIIVVSFMNKLGD